MVGAYADGVPFWNALGAIFEGVVDESHRWARRKNVSAAGNIFFQNIILDSPS
ncbi:hypothetical protein SDC9_111206 [bioreactor metagenome]|uniref:Uncharacterized protein n=1 Tax=bioreactor metagenome TaxID=1076179 RepID=A0A645BFV1_9ZZZZ